MAPLKQESSSIKVVSPNVSYSKDFIQAKYNYTTTFVNQQGSELQVFPKNVSLTIKTDRRVPKLGLMMVGWGGNNGTTLTATILANKFGMTWETKEGVKSANWYGSVTQSSTVQLGIDAITGKEVHYPLSGLLPLVAPDDIVVDGWDISSADLGAAMRRSKVLDYSLQEKLLPTMKTYKPRPSIYFGDFIAANQSDRADNVVKCANKKEALEKIRNDIKDFKSKSGVDKVVVLWTANTERYSDIVPGKNDTVENLMAAIDNNFSEISPSTIFAVASILEGCIYINGSPQNTFVPGVMDLAEKSGAFIAGDDFKSGQTKLKSVLVDFLISAGIKPVSIVSYNHLGNNDGRNLSAPEQFRSKEISKSSVVDDMVASNPILYKPNEKPDHCVVIKYVPYVGDSKRAMDEYISEICLGGHNTLAIHNTCEDSLLAAPLILDLAILAEICTRIQFFTDSQPAPVNFHSVLSILSYLLKAPLVPRDTPVINSLFKQRACIENILKACVGLPPDHNMGLEWKLPKELFQPVAGQNGTATNGLTHDLKINSKIIDPTNNIDNVMKYVTNGIPTNNGISAYQ